MRRTDTRAVQCPFDRLLQQVVRFSSMQLCPNKPRHGFTRCQSRTVERLDGGPAIFPGTEREKAGAGDVAFLVGAPFNRLCVGRNGHSDILELFRSRVRADDRGAHRGQ